MSTTPGELQSPGSQIATVEPRPAPVEQWTPRFAMGVEDAKQLVEAKREFYNGVMREGQHYGKIPGTDKPTLLKPGAELLNASMGLHPECENESQPIVDFQGKTTGGEAFIAFDRRCIIYRQTGPGEHDRIRIAAAGGYCTSWESKYRYRVKKRTCPTCGGESIIKAVDWAAKNDPKKIARDMGWTCWKKADGCGANFAAGSKEALKIQAQEVGRGPNPDVADLANTIKKMADKRAIVAATLLATGCSDIFTQDVEDQAPGGDESPPQNGAAAAPASAPAREKGKARAKTPEPAQTPASEPVKTASPPQERRALGVEALMDLARSIASNYGQVVDLATTIAGFERSAKEGDPFHGFSARKPKALTPTERMHLEDHLLDIRDGLEMEKKGREAHAAAEAPQLDDDEEVNF